MKKDPAFLYHYIENDFKSRASNPDDGFKRSTLNYRVLLSSPDLSQAKGVEEDAVIETRRLHWVAEAVQYAYPHQAPISTIKKTPG